MFSFIIHAASPSDVFGTVAPPPGSAWGANPIAGIGTLIIFLIQVFLILAAIAALAYMLWGAFDWINSGGDPDSIAKARQKITHAVLGIVLVVAVLGIFVLISTDVLKIIRRGPNGEWLFNIPTINNCKPVTANCTAGSTTECCPGLSCKPIGLGSFSCQP